MAEAGRKDRLPRLWAKAAVEMQRAEHSVPLQEGGPVDPRTPHH